MVALLTGLLLALPSGYVVVMAAAMVVWLVTWALHWRAAFTALFVFLPVAAVPGILLQQQGWPTLLKDGLFLLPAYLGLTLSVMRLGRLGWHLPSSLTLALTALGIVIVLQSVRVIGSSPLVALIGLKTWLLYIPLLFVPRVALVSLAAVRRFIRMTLIVSLIPAAVGLIEFGLVLSGHADLAYQWYGDLGSSVTQGFTQVGVSDQILVRRVPSTFNFVTQFVAYCLIAVPIAVVTWMSDPDSRWRRVAGLVSVATVAAGFGSGSRTFYLWGPIEISLVLVLMKRGRLQVATAIVVCGAAAVVAIGSELAQIGAFITGLGWDYLVNAQAAEFSYVYREAGLWGVGAGLDTNGSRYVLGSESLPFRTEGWYALTFLELGLPGVILVLLTWLILIRRAWITLQATRETVAGPIAVGAFVILLCSIVNLYKGVSLEYDPLNIYFWSICGLILILPQLASEAEWSRSLHGN
jgi:hypothetical protein